MTDMLSDALTTEPSVLSLKSIQYSNKHPTNVDEKDEEMSPQQQEYNIKPLNGMNYNIMDPGLSPPAPVQNNNKPIHKHFKCCINCKKRIYRHPKRSKYCWLSCGTFLLISSLQLLFLPQYINTLIHDNITDAFIFTFVDESNVHYQQFITNSGSTGAYEVPIWFSIQFFHITNTYEILHESAIPQISITEPIAYTQYYWRNDIIFSDDGYWCSYDFYVEYYYNREKSGILPTDQFTILSPIISAIALDYKHNYQSFTLLEKLEFHKVVDLVAKDPELLFWSGTAYDLLWSMYDFPRLNIHWGLLHNQTHQYYTTHTGFEDETRFGEILSWTENETYWKNSSAYYLNYSRMYKDTQYIYNWELPMPLSPGHLFYMGCYAIDSGDKNDVKPMWIDILFRNIYLSYVRDYIFKGVTLYQYEMELSPQLDNRSIKPENAQFYQNGPSGVLNVTSAYDNVPMFISMSMFYGAPDYAANNPLFGLRLPSVEKDRPYIDIEPRTGAIFYANASMQLCTPLLSLPENIIQKNKTLAEEKGDLFALNNQSLMVPMYLITFADAVSDEQTKEFQSAINIGDGLHDFFVVWGIVCICLLFGWCMYTAYWIGRRKQNKYLNVKGIQ